MMRRKIFLTLAGCGAALMLGACGSSASTSSDPATAANQAARQKVQDTNASLKAPSVTHDTDYHNYFKAQELYDTPSTIQWCTTSFGTTGSPLVTIPIAGKLTSSSVSLFPSTQVVTQSGGQEGWTNTYNPELPSVDNMFHGSPPPYRYGFTPGGQYVDFSNLAVLCTTALTDFQKQSTTITVKFDTSSSAAQAQAEAALKACQATDSKSSTATSCPAAQAALAGVGK